MRIRIIPFISFYVGRALLIAAPRIFPMAFYLLPYCPLLWKHGANRSVFISLDTQICYNQGAISVRYISYDYNDMCELKISKYFVR